MSGEIFDDGAWLDCPPRRDTSRDDDGTSAWGQTFQRALSRVVDMAYAAKLAQAKSESPIETALGMHLLLRMDGTGLQLEQQYKWQRYRMDFALLRDGEPVLFIECDGKDFHSTPAQLENDRRKDRAATAAGIRMIRFPGSDIWRDPEGCALVALGEVPPL